jgi:PPK2 family polyphosphate:nucleotide phosphotransferase
MVGCEMTSLAIGSVAERDREIGVLMERYRIRPGSRVDLAGIDSREKVAFDHLTKSSSQKVLATMNRELSELQRLLWGDGDQALLVVLQAMDTGGKDGTIRKVFSGVNPQGVDVHGFSVPGPHEAAHDYLWRVHRRTPARGRIGVFNRSHYEDVLVVRVNDLVPESVWSKRYNQIRDFEEMLCDEGTTIVKIMLNISKAEQKERLQARLDDPSKNYKFNPSDLSSREKWDDYMVAYDDAISLTSTDRAPWYIVPSDRKWYRNLVVSQILIDTIRDMGLAYPVTEFDLDGITIE